MSTVPVNKFTGTSPYLPSEAASGDGGIGVLGTELISDWANRLTAKNKLTVSKTEAG